MFTHSDEVDQWFGRLGKVGGTLDVWDIRELLTIHGLLLKLLTKITNREQLVRSFVSKYLHFHNPNVPIYDSVAAGFLPSIVSMQGSQAALAEDVDGEYANYVHGFSK
ncbi:MAG TPA: hypothetical protein VH350_15775, partial [Candidatus Sulfotelmatobacter sp.]|nr:hypothetical protein [Candidatus Sulfotelmatobacter sp.]